MARVTMLLDNPFTRDGRVQKETRSLARAGHRVTVVALAGGGAPARERLADAEVIRVPAPAWAGFSGPARTVPILCWYGRMAPLGRVAGGIPADVVHAHDLTTLGPARRAADRLGAALVFDDHELYVETLNTTYPEGGGPVRRFLYRAMEAILRARGTRLERRVLPGLAGHVVVSEPLADEVVRRYGVPRPSVVANCPPLVPLPVPDGRLRRAAEVPPGGRVVLFAGTMPVRGIGLEDLVDAVPLLPPDVRLALVGWGSGRAALEARAEGLGVGTRTRFLPPVPPEELPAWFADADVSAVVNLPTNLSNLYGLPNKLFESMMSGVPVVAADSPAIRAVVEAHPAGRLYAMGDAADLARAVREVLDAGPAGRAAFVRAGRRAVETRWSWERQEEILLALYERVLAGRPGL